MREAWDTNILVRLLVADDQEQAALVRQRAANLGGDRQAWLSKIVLIETFWVLTRGYHLERARVLASFAELLRTSDFVVEDDAQVASALGAAMDGADFADALIHESARSQKATVLTFDRAAAGRFKWELLG